MNILFITAHPFLPQMKGGLQTSGNELARHLIQRGHKVSLLCALLPSGYLGWHGRAIMKLLGRKAAPDTVLGYKTWRAWFPWEAVRSVIGHRRPDVVIVLARHPVRMALEAKKLGMPILMMLQDVEFSEHGGDFAALGKVPCVANSKFTADRYREAFSVDPIVIPPIIDGSKYITNTTRRNVTFINPHPKKGLNLALEIAKRCPDIPFSFVETWPLTPQEKEALAATLRSLPNVTLRAPVSDMHLIYRDCRILLVPSKWEEAFGRVAIEAQFSGIPVVASNRGGLPEAVGEGGILLDPDGPVEPWVEAIQRLWNDTAYYDTLSTAAYGHTQCASFKLETQVAMWEDAITAAVMNHSAE